ncbi:MAG: 23S rRNA (uracil(1939)-C(5))-methyltransferase [Candidatus Muproteobacteria bacterium RBG_16_62_13]|uniref:23S rRNA (uracil(1939)-C(5))-methyltransferase RlmD n=1 Tax=Candidatus Muproteobacteria bacterium RBG_16_62_13 TaxID=1817756 RepID=A0A1F6SZ56_9PROT|nr:MAG: 23S rRNA (uracil(1939)-C(5))-methyltransferase [Candidatus Muproteobacteria bacterium RBG_16_62_13]
MTRRRGARRAAARPEAPVFLEAIAHVDSLSHEGRGIARIDGKVTFIDGALPGEDVRIRYRRQLAKYDSAETIEVLTPSSDRVTPQCPHFGVCGGCLLQHQAPAAQIAAKQQSLGNLLAHVGKVSPERWLPPLTGPVWGYRRRARLGAYLEPGKGGVLIGFREASSHSLADIRNCLILDERVGPLLPALRALLSSLSCPDRIPQVEVACGDEGVALIVRHLVHLIPQDIDYLRTFAREHGVQIWRQPKGPDSVVPVEPAEPPALNYRLDDGTVMEFGPIDFVQVNAAMNRRTVTQALDLLEPGPADHVLDLFCGIGNFTLPIARRAAHVTGVEADETLLARARYNAGRNGITNADFRPANLYAKDVQWPPVRCDKLLLDPPRQGAIDILKRMPDERPSRIVYVSCFPSTLARDSEYLVHTLGYRLAAAGVMDMFPHTSHVESMTLFVR